MPRWIEKYIFSCRYSIDHTGKSTIHILDTSPSGNISDTHGSKSTKKRLHTKSMIIGFCHYRRKKLLLGNYRKHNHGIYQSRMIWKNDNWSVGIKDFETLYIDTIAPTKEKSENRNKERHKKKNYSSYHTKSPSEKEII